MDGSANSGLKEGILVIRNLGALLGFEREEDDDGEGAEKGKRLRWRRIIPTIPTFNVQNFRFASPIREIRLGFFVFRFPLELLFGGNSV